MNNKKINIDYSALDDLNKNSFSMFKTFFKTSSVIFIPFFALIIIGLIIPNYAYILQFILIPIFLFSPFLGIYNYKKKYKNYIKNRDDIFAKFAQSNRFSFTPGSRSPDEIASVFSKGSSRAVSDMLSGKIGDFSFREGTFIFQTGSSDNPVTNYLEFMCIELPRKLPQIVINPKKAQALSDSYKKSQKISLEGDFDKYFDVYVPTNYERTALTILTPDVMAILIDKYTDIGIEIIDNKLYLFYQYDSSLHNMIKSGAINNIDKYLNSMKTLSIKKMFDSALGLLEQIGRQLSSADILDQDGTASSTVTSNGLTNNVRLKKTVLASIPVVALILIQFLPSIISFIQDVIYILTK